MAKILLLLCILLFALHGRAQTILTHNTCGPVVKTTNHSCKWSNIYWGRDFRLEDFGVTSDEELVIETGEVGLSYASWGTTIQFNIYKIDDNFPASFAESDLLGSSQEVQVWVHDTNPPETIRIDFENPVVIPADVEHILVEVKKGVIPNADGIAHVAGTREDTGTSWYRGCIAGEDYVDAEETNEYYNYPTSDYNFFINAIGRQRSNTKPFYIYPKNFCTSRFSEFSVTNSSEVKNIDWDFGDPGSGASNTSSALTPVHEYEDEGVYTVSAEITANSGKTYHISEEVNVSHAPEAFPLEDAYLCTPEEGFANANSFIIDDIAATIAGDQENVELHYVDEDGQLLEYPIPAYSREYVAQQEEITVRINYIGKPCCYKEETMKIFLQEPPSYEIADLVVCDENSGFAHFDLNEVKEKLNETYEDLSISFFDSDNLEISDAEITGYQNKTINKETITASIKQEHGCEVFQDFDLVVQASPVANPLEDLVGCDKDGDGFSEYFNTGAIAAQVTQDQTQTSLSYFDSDGNQLDELPNPYTNIRKDEDFIIIRITDTISGCYSEVRQNLKTSSKPAVNTPADIYACDEGNGFAHFDTSEITENITGGHNDLEISFYDEDGHELNNFVSSGFSNSVAYEQPIIAIIENRNNKSCATEVSFKLITSSPPEIALENQYEICSMGETLTLQANPAYSSWTWFGPEGNIISEETSVILTAEGVYGLSVLEEKNGVICENYKEFELVHSEAPLIEDIIFSHFSEDSDIEIIASGDGIFEYSIDGVNFQPFNIFPEVAGGTYNIIVQDINGCGEVSKKINLMNYPRFFTPNNDGYNDRWNIQGLTNTANTVILIYDRYGKLLKQLAPGDAGWDGTFNGRVMQSDDYWFRIHLEENINYSGHFSIIR
ncbi:T9SS type B sorting domain-containing protein [Zunongwangia sp. F363]|uniref:T9SS type B sorting domain-containing protein n=1 Tax=Autumnicola tepida TaxID=3075595 RepID=A0ABU3CCY6_9FLAO|nr:T9SS type B sorting domain-containing protein [Zunongwangia sp. F363]MDT0644199.1 T9SS type B sorting domain-containing protein [Zunongwangia sp. F363]